MTFWIAKSTVYDEKEEEFPIILFEEKPREVKHFLRQVDFERIRGNSFIISEILVELLAPGLKPGECKEYKVEQTNNQSSKPYQTGTGGRQDNY